MKKLLLLVNYITIVVPCAFIVAMGMLWVFGNISESVNKNTLANYLTGILVFSLASVPTASILLLYTNVLFPKLNLLENNYKRMAEIACDFGAAVVILSMAFCFIENFISFEGYSDSNTFREIRSTLFMYIFGAPLLIPYFTLKVVHRVEKCS